LHKFIFKRLLMLVPVMLGVSFIIFLMLYLVPGDPVAMILGDTATPEAAAALRQELGLDAPFFIQFFRWIWNLVVNFDLGTSFFGNRSVSAEIMSRLPATAQLAGLSILVAIVIGVPIGIISAIKQYSIFDNVSMFFALLGVSMPNFWQGLLLVWLFALTLNGLLPSSGWTSWQHMILPTVTLATGSMANIARMTRSSMLEIIRQDYIKTARAKGQIERKIIFKHALKNALIPIITAIGLQFGNLLGGAVLTETIFSIPGIGRLMIDAIGQRDYPIVQGTVLFIALTFSLINLIVDILYSYADPRIKSAYK